MNGSPASYMNGSPASYMYGSPASYMNGRNVTRRNTTLNVSMGAPVQFGNNSVYRKRNELSVLKAQLNRIAAKHLYYRKNLDKLEQTDPYRTHVEQKMLELRQDLRSLKPRYDALVKELAPAGGAKKTRKGRRRNNPKQHT